MDFAPRNCKESDKVVRAVLEAKAHAIAGPDTQGN